MAGHVFGGGGSRRERYLHSAHAAIAEPMRLQSIEPSAQWTGVNASGFDAVPTDPARVTAKPAIRLLVPDYEVVTDSHLVGVYAGANDNGSLIRTMGLAKVTFHFEGASVDVTQPSFQTFADADGNPVTRFGYWCRLQHNGTNGYADLYVEATPTDPTMQRRVIGPYRYRMASTPYDHEVVIDRSKQEAWGSSFREFDRAFSWLRSVGAITPRIRVIDAGTGVFDIATGVAYANGWRCVVESDVPIVFAKPDEASKGRIRPRWGSLDFRGSNITFDMRWINELWLHENAAIQPVFRNCRFINSGGRAELWDKGTRTAANGLSRSSGWYLECEMSDTWYSCQSAALVRGCTLRHVMGDQFTGTRCVIGNTMEDSSLESINAPVAAMTYRYVGTAAAATMEMGGSLDATSRTFTARVDGTSVGSFTVYQTKSGHENNFAVRDVADWINALPDWTATVLDDTRRATGFNQVGGDGQVDAKSAPVTVSTAFDIHDDWTQVAADIENRVIAENTSYAIGSPVFLSQTFEMRDWLIANNAWQATANNRVQIRGVQKHVVFVHNSVATQPNFFSGSWDDYSLVANNAFVDNPVGSYVGGRNNHYQAGASATDVTGASFGGDDASLFADAAHGEFAPRGALLDQKKVPALRYGAKGAERPVAAPAGARAA